MSPTERLVWLQASRRSAEFDHAAVVVLEAEEVPGVVADVVALHEIHDAERVGCRVDHGDAGVAASSHGGEAVAVDPVASRVECWGALFRQ